MTGINAWHLQWYALDGMLHGILSLFDTFWYHLEKSEHSGVLLITIWHVGNFNKHGMNQQSCNYLTKFPPVLLGVHLRGLCVGIACHVHHFATFSRSIAALQSLSKLKLLLVKRTKR